MLDLPREPARSIHRRQSLASRFAAAIVLTIIPSTSVLTFGGGSGSSALAGRTIRVPAERRAVVQNLLSLAGALFL